MAMYDFTNRTLVVTGANGGIGREVARQFYACGANLVLTDLHIDGLNDFARTLSAHSERIVTSAMDSASAADCDRIVKIANDTFGGIDFLVPSAGIYKAHPVREMTDEQWRETLSINLDGVFFLCKRAIPFLRENSSIVNLSSVAAHRGAFYNAHYSAAKGALISLTRSLARELGPSTRVNAVSPGVIDTPMASDLIRLRGADSIAQTPLKRVGQPGEIASVIAFLCSQGASFITGEVIHVNGGLHMAG
jgi:3-oxoacyl-[acyl-carrier protein] reductase